MKKIALLLLAVALPLPAQQPASDLSTDPVLEKNVAVPMRDGVLLRANILRPQGQGPFPTLVYRTPYDKEEALQNHTIFRKAAARGYAVVVGDVRGRYASAGEFVPYQNEGRDGYDTIEWAARQPWSNGAVGTFGLSYPGAVQWLAAVESPPHLKAMVPAMTYATASNFFYSGGVFDLSWIGWIWNYIAPDVRAKKSLPGPRTDDEVAATWKTSGENIRKQLPLSALAELKEVAPYYYEWMRHPPGDPWWEWAELRGKFHKVNAAVLSFSGWYDEAYGPDGATSNFNGLVAVRRGQDELRAAMVMGPWTHGIATIHRTRAGERELGEAARSNYDEMVLRWMDRYVKGIENDVAREKPVRYFVMGENVWREQDSWPPPATPTSFYLSASSGGRSLSREAPRGKNSFTEFVSDPADPVTDPFSSSSGGHDYRALEKRADVVVFDSAPLAEDTEVTGPIAAEIHLSCDAPDTDLWVRLLDVAPDGTAYNLMAPGLDVLRASYRNGGPRRELLTPGRVYKLHISTLLTSNLFRKGHRIRVQVSTAFFPHLSHNLHTGELEMESSRMRQARVRIYHDQRRASRVILPVVRRTQH